MILSDRDIRRYIGEGKLVVEPMSSDTIRANGLDLRIGGVVARPREVAEPVDPESCDPRSCYEVADYGEYLVLRPGEHVLIHTLEYIRMPRDVVGLIGIRSTYARMGLHTPLTVVDAGYEGQLTVQLRCGSIPLRLRRGARVVHLVLVKALSEADRPYSGRYQGRRGISLPR
ncbi:dCTP deaminase [Candidatus Geothermarchaeota archaeon ex4572_27]|nr:MAG: dCTP deaminase [Candidatus Geothermarchaeota archaeon ex4572_27]